MFVYSKKIIRFMELIQHAVRDILQKEIGLKVTSHRFYDKQKRYSYPIKVVIYNNKSILGYFDPNFYELGFHECLMHSPREQLLNVIRHELAHYITSITHGMGSTPHSDEFKAFCKKMKWSEEVEKAALKIDKNLTDSQEQEYTVLRKIKKLLALASSSNAHEAELAMLKSQQLLLKHHMEAPSLDEEHEEQVILKRIMKHKRINAKIQAISQILTTFFVSVVHNRSGEYTYLEIVGDKVNVSIAEYVAEVLHHELDHLWDTAHKSSFVRGTIAKNSFFIGMARGYCNKVRALQQQSIGCVTNALILLEKKLIDTKALIYPHTTTQRSKARYCRQASLLGEQMGKQLSIKPAINKNSKQSETLLLR